jgi:hypothetical protein
MVSPSVRGSLEHGHLHRNQNTPDLETYLEHYNRKRPHRGRGMKGRTPYQIFTDTLPRTPEEEVTPKAA